MQHLSRKHQFSSERPRCQSGPHCPVSKLLHANSQPLTPQSCTKLVPSIPLDPPDSSSGQKKLSLDSCSTLEGNTSSEQPRCQLGPHCPVSKVLLHANSQPLTLQSYHTLVPSILRIVGKVQRSCHSIRAAPPCEFSTTDGPILHHTGSVDPSESRYGPKKLRAAP